VPALIDVKTSGPADEAQLEKLRKLLGRVAPAARVDAQSHWLSPVFGAIDRCNGWPPPWSACWAWR
jgi:cell division transport system permease protein